MSKPKSAENVGKVLLKLPDGQELELPMLRVYIYFPFDPRYKMPVSEYAIVHAGCCWCEVH